MKLAFGNFLRNLREVHTKKKIFYFRALTHVIKFIFIKSFREENCLIDPPFEFIYKYKSYSKYFSIPISFVAKNLKKNNVFISINNNCNSSIGHIFSEIDTLKRIQKSEIKYKDSKIIFTTTKKNILNSSKDIFETDKFKLLFGGVKSLILTFVAIRHPNLSIDGSLGQENVIFGNKPFSPRICYNSKSKKRAKLIKKSQDFYPNKDIKKNFEKEFDFLSRKLNISKKYIVIQMKTTPTNATFEPAQPKDYFSLIDHYSLKDYDIVFAGRETFPESFKKKQVINYANSRYATPLNDYILVKNSSLVISSASGFCNIAETLDKPLLIFNSFHGVQQYGRRTIILPTILKLNEKALSPYRQHSLLCLYGQKFGRPKGFPSREFLKLFHKASQEEILASTIELEQMVGAKIPEYTNLQKKIIDSKFPLLCYGSSRISNFFLDKHWSYFSENL